MILDESREKIEVLKNRYIELKESLWLKTESKQTSSVGKN